MKKFNEKKLSRNNGKNGNPVYVGYNGKIYDLSNSFLWKNGIHQVIHNSGMDLTKALEQAPHRGDIIKKFPVVGILLRQKNIEKKKKV